jgi:hypothetical protein
MLNVRKSHYENYDSLNSTASSRAVSRALYSDQNRLDMTLNDGIRSFINVLRLQAPKSDSKITKNTQNTRWPFLAPPDHANAPHSRGPTPYGIDVLRHGISFFFKLSFSMFNLQPQLLPLRQFIEYRIVLYLSVSTVL